MSKRRRSYLTEEDVAHLKACLAAGMTQEEVAREFLITRPQVSNILHGRSWSWVPEAQNAQDQGRVITVWLGES